MSVNLKVRDKSGERVIEMRQDRAIFGRSSDCTVQIEDTMASREHCRIERQGENEFKLIDLESRNGTRVNGMHVNQHRLVHGDQIQIGEVTVVFECPDARGGGATAPAASKPASGAPRAQSGTRSKHSTRRVGRRRGRGAGNELAIVGAIACLVISVGALAMILGGGGESSAEKLLAQAQRAFDRGEYAEARRQIARIPASEPVLQESGRALEQKIGAAEKAAEDEDHIRQADHAFKLVEADEKKGKLKGDKLHAAYKEVSRLYPGTAAARQAQARLTELAKKTPAGKDPLAELAGKTSKLISRNEFQAALDLYQAYWDKTGDKRATPEIEKINEQANRAYRDLHHRAQAALSGGDKQRAREFYQEVKRSFGGSWAQQADSELGRIK